VPHGDRPPAKGWLITLLNRREEGVHIDVDDLPDGMRFHERSLARRERKGNGL
jgi:hypothetical protein